MAVMKIQNKSRRESVHTIVHLLKSIFHFKVNTDIESGGETEYMDEALHRAAPLLLFSTVELGANM